MNSESDEVTVEDDTPDYLFSLADLDDVAIELEEKREADIIRELQDGKVPDVEIEEENSNKTHTELPASCKVCGKELKNRATLKNHMLIKHHENKSGKEYKCKHCDFSSYVYRTYKYHAQVHRKVPETVCTICGVLVRKDNFNKHVAYHRKDPPVSCDICGKVLKNKIILKAHMLVHQNNSFQCAQCGKVYKYRQGYTAHMKRHTAGGNKTVTCPVCKKQFYDKKVLSEHIRIHTGQRPYQCAFCNKQCSTSYGLKSHNRQHTKERAYSCNQCSMAFIHKSSLKNHVKSKHPVQKKEAD